MAQALSLQRFQQEAQAASTLKHPNIISVQDFGTTSDGEPFIVMDYIEGSSLAEEIEDYEYLPIDRSVRIFLQVADALVHAHSKGIVHRDLKPSNIILIVREGVHDHVNIVDFGIAKMMPQEGAEALNLTQTGEVFGSPLYMSPEQSRGEKLDARSDIYSMGCLMYETLTGRHAIAGENTMEVLYNHLNQVPEPMNRGDIKIPTALEKIIFTALAKDPAQRFQSMADLHEHLRTFSSNRHGNLARKLADHWSVFWLRRKPRTARAKAAIVAGFAAFMIIVFLSTNLVSLYLAAAQSPEADTKIVWFEDNRPIELPPQGLNGEIAYNMFLRKTQILSDDHADPNDIINEFEVGADSLAKKKLWNEANRLLHRAVDLSLQSNGQVTIKTVDLQAKFADSYQAMHKYSEASAVYATIFRALSREFGRDVEDQALLSFRSGSNSYFLGQWLESIRLLNQSYDVWMHRRRKPGGHMHFFSVPDDILSSYDFGLLLSRLASAHQRLYEESVTEGAPDASHLYAAIDFYKQAIAFWSSSPESSAKFNEAVAQANYLVLAPQDDRSVERENLVAEYKENFAPTGAFAVFPEDSIYRAIVLQDQAKFLMQQHDYFDAFNSRLAAWKILAARYKANH
jgi:serine/threonine protein kinase